MVTRQFEFSPGQFSTVVDNRGTEAANPGVKPSVIGKYQKEWAADDTGHSGNIEAAKLAENAVSDACGATSGA